MYIYIYIYIYAYKYLMIIIIIIIMIVMTNAVPIGLVHELRRGEGGEGDAVDEVAQLPGGDHLFLCKSLACACYVCTCLMHGSCMYYIVLCISEFVLEQHRTYVFPQEGTTSEKTSVPFRRPRTTSGGGMRPEALSSL